jgi:hypothetical protein
MTERRTRVRAEVTYCVLVLVLVVVGAFAVLRPARRPMSRPFSAVTRALDVRG